MDEFIGFFCLCSFAFVMLLSWIFDKPLVATKSVTISKLDYDEMIKTIEEQKQLINEANNAHIKNNTLFAGNGRINLTGFCLTGMTNNNEGLAIEYNFKRL